MWVVTELRVAELRSIQYRDRFANVLSSMLGTDGEVTLLEQAAATGHEPTISRRSPKTASFLYVRFSGDGMVEACQINSDAR